ncbi:MAG: hypothetical protein HQL13_08430, partial [Candidatus Omnitrophica bacterium]|nr:hypothetical protein [Candidatus Omnitrophota bacterium]
EINVGSGKAETRQLIQSVIHKVDVDHYKATAKGGGNTFFIKIKDCRLKILENIPNNPSANDLADPTQRDQVTIENKINELAQQMGFIAPTVRYLFDSRLKTSSRQKRHQIETPLIEATVCELLRKENKRLKSVKVGWLKSGRP